MNLDALDFMAIKAIVGNTSAAPSIDEISEAVSDIVEDSTETTADNLATLGTTLMANIAQPYSAENTYNIGDVCAYESIIYKAAVNITTPEAFDATHWTRTSIADIFVKKVTLTVECNTTDGAVVTGETVYLRQGHTASDPIVAQAPYNGQPVSFVVSEGFSFHISTTNSLAHHFAPDPITGVIDISRTIILTYSDTTHINSFNAMQSALHEDIPDDALIGIEINDTWTDAQGGAHDDPMRCVAIKQVEDENGELHRAAIMQRIYAGFYDMQFDAEEKCLATGGTYQDGLFYWVYNGTSIQWLTKGTDYTVGNEITGEVYVQTRKDTNIINYGYNRYRDSGIRQYLNSSAGLGQWWTEKHIGDMPPSQLASTKGYMTGCSAALLAVVKPIKIYCYTNTDTDGGIIDVMIDTFWLPSGNEMNGSVNANEGDAWPYWVTATGSSTPSNSANVNRIFYAMENHNTKKAIWLRSAYRSYSYYVWLVITSGEVGYSGSLSARSSYGVAPACCIY